MTPRLDRIRAAFPHNPRLLTGAAADARSADLAVPDWLPACPRCGDLNSPAVDLCVNCGARLYPAGTSNGTARGRLRRASQLTVADPPGQGARHLGREPQAGDPEVSRSPSGSGRESGDGYPRATVPSPSPGDGAAFTTGNRVPPPKPHLHDNSGTGSDPDSRSADAAEGGQSR